MNTREIELTAFRERQETELQQLEAEKIDLLIDVHIDLPTDARMVAADVLASRLIQADVESRNQGLDCLWLKYQGQPHNVCRVLSVYVLLRLLDAGVQVSCTYVSNLKHEIRRLAIENANYWQSNALSNALCHLDNASLRLAKTIGNRLAMEVLSGQAEKLNAEMAADERLKFRQTTAGLMIPFVALLGEHFWRQYCSLSDANGIWEGIWTYEVAEEAVERLPQRSYPDGNSDLLWFEYYGRGFDILRLGTWDVLNRCDVNKKQPDFGDDVLAFAGMNRNDVIATIPPPKARPAQWSGALPKILESILKEAGRMR